MEENFEGIFNQWLNFRDIDNENLSWNDFRLYIGVRNWLQWGNVHWIYYSFKSTIFTSVFWLFFMIFMKIIVINFILFRNFYPYLQNFYVPWIKCLKADWFLNWLFNFSKTTRSQKNYLNNALSLITTKTNENIKGWIFEHFRLAHSRISEKLGWGESLENFIFENWEI